MLFRFGDIRSFHTVLLALVVLSGCDSTDTNRGSPGPPPEGFLTDRTPAWSPDGNRIAYFHDAGETEDTTDVSGLYVRDLETDSTWLVVEGLALRPDWRPDGKRLAFSTGDIFTIRPDGSDLHRVTAFGSSFKPRWSPDGQTLSFGRSGTRDEVGIWFAHLSDSTFTKFGFGATPADWSPSGRRIVYNFEDQLWTADTSRNDSTQITDNDFVDNSEPAWSPNGEWIAWVPETDEGLTLSVMRADGSEKQRLVESAANPAWAPDSERLVFVKPESENGRTALWIIRRDGSDLRQLTDPSRNPLN